MSLTVSDIIEGAELRAEPYVPSSGAPKGVLIRQLDGLDSEIVNLVAIQVPTLLSSVPSDITIVLATNSTGYSLEAARKWFNFQWVDSDGNIFPLRVVNERDYSHPPIHPSGIIRGTTFYPCDPIEKEWSGSDARHVFVGDGDVVTYSYIPEHTQLTATSDTCEGPDFAREYYETSLALNLMLSAPYPVPQGKMLEMRDRSNSARRDLLLAIAKQAPIESSINTSSKRMY